MFTDKKTLLFNSLLVCFVFIIFLLLIGQLFGCEWASGNGWRTKLPVTVVSLNGNATVTHFTTDRPLLSSDVLERGEIITTSDEGYVLLTLSNHATLALAERTQITLDRIFNNEITITVHKGRVIASLKDNTTSVCLLTNLTKTILQQGSLTLVNYDFLETISVVPFSEGMMAEVSTLDQKPFSLTSPINIHETEPREISEITFNTSSDFYNWYALQ
ncbi:MAG: hypothetical protein UU08_C0003G0034 [Candidatus Uhrbacteria bacterium GW2011_GWE2_40_58]|nr:MAG: hypothetical protein UT94_C0004G0034 [Candidatus Uhrbacteria bacterium GW2011_GWF2_40_263]KKR68111.1 MAG: hypothetical protein UU08_C0003G0034 [Candidatus Uhrbacteria bacterium GW2011_GWE2_40_58]